MSELRPNGIRRGPFRAAAKLVVGSVAQLFDVPSARDTTRAARKIVSSLKPDIFKMPNRINELAQEQISFVDDAIKRVEEIPGVEIDSLNAAVGDGTGGLTCPNSFGA
ncbi:hypothetical protein CTheo_9141 [Ceratobasidium theobromae]|uniref:Uncharacterized protein n=1 Tax=Ceratobasidium theobromae TaxID=1582974 RepID=A0A5N5Q7K8_9AGAM|nr:hypothetical protein CTheo_9141 [Ceratobasidium theobromae]